MKKYPACNYASLSRLILCFAVFIITGVEVYGQSAPLDSATLAAQPVFTSIRQASQNPEKVYRLSLDGVIADVDQNAETEMPKFKNLQELTISGKRFKGDTLPGFITELPNLRTLALFYTSFHFLPSSIEKLQKLENLYIRGSLYSLPEQIGQLKNLTSIHILESAIAVLPESIGNLKKLKNLLLYYSPISSIPASIGGAFNLKILWISGTKITSIPVETGFLAKLEKLRIENNPLLSGLPAELFYLGNLKELVISGNEKVLELPSDFSKLKNLHRMEISYTSLGVLPAMTGMKSLNYLKLQSNQNLLSLPVSMSDLEALEELVLIDCRFQALPKSMKKLKSLSKVSLQQLNMLDWESSMNSLSQCKSLKELNINRNEMTAFPKSLSKLSKLEKLIFISGYNSKTVEQFNWEESIKTLSALGNLKTLDISENKIKTLPSSFMLLKKLDSLQLKHNDFSAGTVSFDYIKNLDLVYLGLEGCGIKKISRNITQLQELRALDLSRNFIDSIPDHIDMLKALTVLELSTESVHVLDRIIADMTYLQYISPSLYHLSNLRRLNLSGNPYLKETKEDIRKKLPAGCVLEYDH